MWPDPDEMIRVLVDPELLVKPPTGPLYAPDAADMDKLCTDPRWALWIWNPNLDFIVPTAVAAHQWANLVLAPLHAPCLRAIRALGPALLQRVRHGEVTQSHRRRYISHRAPN